MAFPTFNSLASFSASQAAEIEAYVSMVIGYLSEQHTDTGAHSAVTADSVETTGDVDAGGHGEFDGDVIAQRNTSGLQVGLGAFAEFNGGTAPVTLGAGVMFGGLTNSLLLMRSAKPSYMSSGQAYGLCLFDRALSTSIPILAYGTDGGTPVLGSGDTGVTKLQLGTATKSLGDIFATGITGTTFTGGETGTWTPALSFGGGATGITYSTRTGNYTKICGLVFAEFRITLSSKGSSTGAAAISGLPYSASFLATSVLDPVANFSGLTGAPFSTLSSASMNLLQTTATGRTGLLDTNFANTSDLIGSVVFRT